MIWKINHVVETSCRRSTIALTGTATSDSSLNTRCNVGLVPVTIWPWICLCELTRSAHCRSMRRWTLNGYMALIRSTSLTRSYVRISLRGICVLSVNEVAKTWKVPSEAAKWLLKLRERRGCQPDRPHANQLQYRSCSTLQKKSRWT